MLMSLFTQNNHCHHRSSMKSKHTYITDITQCDLKSKYGQLQLNKLHNENTFFTHQLI